jgi:hypothetical protein
MGASLGATDPDPGLGADLADIVISPYSHGCPPGEQASATPSPDGEHPDPFAVSGDLESALEEKCRGATHTPWTDAAV